MITLLNRNVAIAPIRDPDVSPGGIIIPDIAKERADQGIIKYVGPKVRTLKIGDYVLFSGYSGTVVRFERDGDGTCILMDERYVMAKLGNPDTEVSGLYFKGKIDFEFIKSNIEKLIEEVTLSPSSGNPGFDRDILANGMMNLILLNDPYFPATYEMAMNLIAESFQDTDFAKNTGFKNPLGAKPALDEYDMLEDDNEDEQTKSDIWLDGISYIGPKE